MAKGGESAVVRVFGREVAWEVPSRSSAHADVVAALEPATEKLESWRYSPIDDVSVASYAAAAHETIDVGVARAVLDAAGRSGGLEVVVGPRGLVDARAGEGFSVAGDRATQELGAFDEEPFATLANVLAPERVDLRLDGVAEAALIVGGSGHESAAFAWIKVLVTAPTTLWLVDGAGPATLASALIEVEVVDGVHASLNHLSLGGAGSIGFLQLTTRLGADADLVVAEVAAQGGYHRTRSDVHLAGERARVRIRSAFVAGSDEVEEFRTFVVHAAPRTASDLLYKGALTGSGTSVYSGLITIEPAGHGSDAFQTNRNLLLSPEARAESVPNLDIQVSDVRCSHASTVGPLEAELVFALEAKGIDPDRAQRILADGFFADIADLTEGERALVRRALEERWLS